MRGFLIATFAAAVAVAAAPAWSFNLAFRKAGLALHQAEDEAQRLAAMREMVRAARASDDPAAGLVTEILATQGAALAGSLAFEDFLDRLAEVESLVTVGSYAVAVGANLAAAAEIVRPTEMDLKGATRLADAIKRLDHLAKQKGLPTSREILAEMSRADARSVGIAINALVAAAEFAKSRDAVEPLTDAAIRKFQDRFISIVPATMQPFAVAVPVARDQIRWTGRQFEASAQGLDLVAQAIETGQFDTAAYERLRARMLDDFRRGPWDRATARDALVRLCKTASPLGPFCSDLFKVLDKAFQPEICRAIDCDCDGIRAGILNLGWVPECRNVEKVLREECRRTHRVTGYCHDTAHGPLALPLRP